MEQISFVDDSPRIEETNQPHLACVLLLDTSGSMRNCIDNLNNAIDDFKNDVCKSEESRNRIDVAVVEFNTEVNVIQDFVPITELKSAHLRADGYTAMGRGINTAIDLVKRRNQFYYNLGTPFFKPWIFMITDGHPEGEPSTEIERARSRIAEEESKGSVGKLKFFAVAVEGADRDLLKTLTKRVMKLSEAKFDSLFNWLADSMVTISISTPNEEAPLNPLPPGVDRDVSDW